MAEAERRPSVPPTPASVPRFAGLATFARLPTADQVARWDIGVVGVPFDGGTSYRPGARFGPAAVRQGSRLLRPVPPGARGPALRAGPGGRRRRHRLHARSAPRRRWPRSRPRPTRSCATAARLVAIGGDHTIALPLLRATARRHGPLALVHFDAHLDTWDTYFGQRFTHGTPFRRAWEEGLLLRDHSVHVGLRGPLYSDSRPDRRRLHGLRADHAPTTWRSTGWPRSCERMLARVGDAPVYVSVDIDVLDPAHAPGTGTPEAGGLTSRELLALVRGLATGRRGGRRRGGGLPRLRPCRDHGDRRRARALRPGHDHGGAGPGLTAERSAEPVAGARPCNSAFTYGKPAANVASLG